MYAKLALRNIRRSLRDYIIYFVTLTLTAALMYSFLALGFSSEDVYKRQVISYRLLLTVKGSGDTSYALNYHRIVFLGGC